MEQVKMAALAMLPSWDELAIEQEDRRSFSPCSRQITSSTPYHSRQYTIAQFFCRLDALPAAQPTVSKH